jgi:hypothetical protein
MSNLVKVINNALENKRFKLENELEVVLQDTSLTFEEKEERTLKTLGEFAIAEISSNLWKMYTTKPEEANEAQPTTQPAPAPQGPSEKASE